MKRQLLLVLVLCFSVVATACQPIRPTSAATSAVTDASANAVAQWQPAQALPLDPNVRTGKLANGLTYYIRHNAEPAGRAELRLAVNAGSVLEDEDQKGLAHFIEHMLFNGTKHFEKQALVDYLESVGMRFGADLNAYTSFDETVYMLQVPTDKPEILAKGFDILQDWSSAATLDPKEVDAERGVIVEEWRLSDQGAQGRITNKWFPFVLAGSKYAQRLPIGDMDIVRNAPAETLRRFYKTWYRPDLMAVIAVGDFDVDQVEGYIKERFNTVAEPQNPVARPQVPVTLANAPRTMVITDPENPYALVGISYLQPAKPLKTVADYQDHLLTDLSNQMLNQRFDEIARQQNAPFVNAVSYQSDLVRPVTAYDIQAQVQAAQIQTGTIALAAELERVQRYGYTDTELARAKQALLRRYEGLFTERAKSESANYADEYINYFLTGTAAPGIAVEYALVQRLLPAMTLAAVNQHFRAIVTQKGRDVLVIAPQKAGVQVPSEADLNALFATVQKADIAPYVDKVADAKLLTAIPTPAAIVSETNLTAAGATALTLANGVRVILKPTDFKDDEVVMRAVSPGGSSLVGDADFPEADHISQIVAQSGVGDFDYNQLTRLLAGKLVAVSPYIDTLQEGFSGRASPKDLETLFQLIYLYVTKPRADEAAFAAFQNQMRADLENRALSPQDAFGDAITQARYGDAVRYRPLTLEEVNTFDLKRAFAIYQDRFADMSDFTFVFVGNFDGPTLKKLAQEYLGTLPSTHRAETWVDVVPNPPAEKVEKAVYKGQDPQSLTLLAFTGQTTQTVENNLRLQLLADILDIRLGKDLREARSAAYSTSATGRLTLDPDKTYTLQIFFGSDPKRVDELLKATFGQISDLQQHGPTAQELATAKEQERRDHEKQLKENQYWLGQLTDYALHPSADTQTTQDEQKVLDAINESAVQNAAQVFLPDNRYIQVVLYPESAKPK